MIKKRKISMGLSVILVLALGIGVLKYSGYDFVQPVKQETKATINDMSKAIEIILKKGTNDFYEGYPVDQAFLLWVNKNFGDDTIMDIAYQMYEGYVQEDLWYRETGNSLHVLWLMYCEDLQYATYYLDNVYWMETVNNDVVTMDFTGDINLADDWYTMKEAVARENGIYDCISEEVVNELQSADISVINNEFVFTDGGDRQTDKAYTFGAKTSNVSMLEVFGADLANLANNHAYDYRTSGLMDTMHTLEEFGIVTMGAGENIEEAKAIPYFVANGKKIAFVSATEIERYTNYTKEATETEAGVLKTLDPVIFESVVREAAENSDYVIANVHWGNEGSFQYSASQASLAKRLIDAGADAIIGGHPHRLQGIEYIDDVPVLYSLGNFWFSTGTLYTTIAQLQIDKAGDIHLRMIPCIQKNLTTSMLSEEETDAFYKFMADVSTGIAINEEGYVFNTKDGRYLDLIVDDYYFSGTGYGTYAGLKDLEGRSIDIVGNLQ